MATQARDLPPIPPGFELEALPPIPPGFQLEVAPGGRVVDGDTFALADGRNARMSGVDAFEKDQQGIGPDGAPVSLGQRATSFLRGLLSPASKVAPTGDVTYGRPVVTVANDGADAGASIVGEGVGLPTPEYLANDPARLADYMRRQREAIAAERGAYAGQYQTPADYRHKGDAAPMRGKIPMTTRQKVEYSKLLRSPDTTPEALDAWFAEQGHQVANGANILDFMRRNPRAKASLYFQQQDALDQPVLPDGPGTIARTLGALNEGVADTLGAPVDLVNSALGLVGAPVSDTPFLGSESIRSGLHALGVGQDGEAYAPRSAVERYLQSISRGVGQVAIPAGGMIGAGGRIAAAGAVANEGGAVAQALRRLATEASARPGLTIAGEAASGAGAGIGGQAARDAAPGNPWADLAGQLLGGALGGVGGAAAASRMRRPAPSPRPAIEAAPAMAAKAATEIPGGARVLPDGRLQVDIVGGEPPAVAAVAGDLPVAAEAQPPVGRHGPIHTDLATDYPSAVARLMLDETGEVPGALSHPATGPIDLIWGEAGTGKSDGYGLAKIAKYHPEVLDDLPNIVASMEVRSATPGRVQLESTDHKAAVRLEFDGQRKTWLLTAFRKEGAPASTMDRRAEAGGQSFTDHGADPDISRTAAMDNGMRDAAVSAPIDDLPPIPPGFVLDPPDLAPRARVRPLDQRATAEEMAELARTVNPEDVTPLPANTIDGLDEAVRANPGTIRDMEAPNERDVLPSYRLREGGPVRKDPIDLLGWLRTKGGIRDQGGDLAHMGIDNKPRPIDFAKSEGFLGRLVNDDGMNLDDAAHDAWEAGFFPDHVERPTVSEFLDALRETHAGGPGRVFHPDDYDTIDAFHAARAQRGAVETAAQEGAPLAEDIGQPVGPDDLDANQPPATAYEDLPALADRAGNIDISKLETRGDIVRAVHSVHRKAGGFDAARRGVVSHAETEALASELRMTADDLLKRGQGQALNAEQALAARSILAKSADELVRLAGKAKGGSDTDLANFRKAWVRHVAIQEQVSGLTAEAGRTLSQFRMMAKSKMPIGRIHALQIEGAGGRESLEEAAQAVLDTQGNPGALNQTARLALKPKLKDKLIELYYNSLLSGPATHAVNVLSNAMTAGLQLPEHMVAAGLGGVRAAIRRNGAAADRVLTSEVGARAVGLVQGVREGLKAFAHTARTGDVPDYVTKVEAASQEAISGLKGKIIRTPTRLLSAEDELFKAVARKMEMAGLAVRHARSEGLKGPALKARIADLTANPTDAMVERSMDYARYLTFQTPLGKLGNLMTAATQEAPLLKLIVPFVRTPTNILKFAAERSPAAPILKGWRDDFMAGGARRDLAVARMAMGTGLGMLATQWATDGVLTGGGPADRNARSLLLADGWQPYSVRLGDTYYSYQRFDPLASTLGVAADLVETSQYMTESQRERSAMLVTAAIIKNLSNKVWLSGITNFAQAIDDPERYATGLAGQMAGGIAVPAIVAQTARVVDPVLRDARGPIDRIKTRVPGLSLSMPAKRDVWGEVIKSEGGIGPDIMSPMRVRTAKNDPVAAELLRLGQGISPLQRKVDKRQLSPVEYGQYQEVAGKLLRAELEARLSAEDWATLDDETKTAEIDRAKKASRKEAKSLLFGASPK